MPLPLPTAVIRRFGLLEQTVHQKELSKEFESLINSPSTPNLLRNYFNLLKDKQNLEQEENPGEKTQQQLKLIDIKIQTLFLDYERNGQLNNEDKQLLKLTQAHLALSLDDKDKAGDLIAGLKASNNSIAYRLEAEMTTDPQKKRELYQQAADGGELVAKGLLGNDYTSYLLGPQTNTPGLDSLVLERFGLLEETLNKEKLPPEFDVLLNSPSTPKIFKDYFTLLGERKKIEDGSSTNRNEEEEKEYQAKLEQNQLEIDTLLLSFDLSKEEAKLAMLCEAHWATRNKNTDTALPLINQLKQDGIATAYRLEGELTAPGLRNKKTELYQQAADRGDLVARRISVDFQNTVSHSIAKPSNYFLSGLTSASTHFLDALHANEPLSISKRIAFLNEVTKKLEVNDSNKLAKLLSEAEGIAEDTKLSGYIKDIESAIEGKDNIGLAMIKQKMVDYINGEYKDNQLNQVKNSITESAKQAPSLKEVVQFREALNPLNQIYEEEIARMRNKGKLSPTESTYLNKLQEIRKDLAKINNLEKAGEARDHLEIHYQEANEVLKTVPHSNSLMRVMENVYNTIKQRANSNFIVQFLSGKERKKVQKEFQELKIKLNKFEAEQMAETKNDEESPNKAPS